MREDRPVTLKTVLAVLACSSFLGALFGIFVYPNWQVMLIPTKILAGEIVYPFPNLPQYINVKSWNLLSQVFASLMSHGVTESQLCRIASGIQGMAALGGISLIALAITRVPLLSVCCGPIFLYFGLWHGGIAYPIHLIGFHSYGIVGLDFALLTVGLFCVGLFLPAAFLAGLLLCIHPSWGVWTGAVLGLYFLLRMKDIPNKVGTILCMCAGLAISYASYRYQLQFIPDLSALSEPLRNPELSDSQYFMAYLHSWTSTHRKLGMWVYQHKEFFVLVWGAASSLILLTRYREAASPGLKRFAWFQLLFFLFTLAISTCITVFPEKSPTILHVIMPNRFWGMSFLLTTLTVLLLGFAELNNKYLKVYLFVATALLILQSHTKTHLLLAFAPLLAGMLLVRKCNTGEFGWSALLKKCSMALFCGAAIWAVAQIPIDAASRKALRYDGGDPIPMTSALSALERDNGATAVSPTVPYYLQARIDAPVVFSMEMQAAAYATEIMPLVDQTAEDILGEGFVRPYLENRPAQEDPFSVWESRSTEEWTALMRKYGIDNIVVRADESLNLPLLAEDGSYRVYRRPASSP